MSLKRTIPIPRQDENDIVATLPVTIANLLRRLADFLDRRCADTKHSCRDDSVSDKPIVTELSGAFAFSKPTHQRPETEVELLTLGKIAAVLERQLKDVNQDIEKSVIGISQGFQGMAQQAQAAVNVVGSVADDDTGGNGKIREMQTVINRLVKHMNESCESLGDASDRLLEMEGRLDGVETVLSGIEEIAARSRLMALNGQIEAGRLGAAGAAFAVVAAETKQLSQHAADTSSRAQGLLSELSGDITTTTKELSARSTDGISRLSESRQEAESILNYIEENRSKAMRVLSETGSISRDLQGSISRAVISLQFQDRVSQRLEHIVNSLNVVCERIHNVADHELDSVAEERSRELLNELSRGYTMDAERLAMAGEMSPAGKSDSGFEVELF